MRSHQAEVDRLYELLEIPTAALRLRFGHIPSPHDIPLPRTGEGTRGVYFFFEPGELRANGNASRVVRIGSHSGDKSSIESRIVGEHTTNWGRSVFRRHLGTALIQRGDFDTHIQPADRAAWATKWYSSIGGSAVHTKPAHLHEILHPLHPIVTRTICDMSVVWVEIPEKEKRLEFEKQCIRLLSNYLRPDAPIDPASATWLGHFALREDIQSSGLWNLQHVKNAHTPGFLDSYREYF
jgi:hypothetical protein